MNLLDKLRTGIAIGLGAAVFSFMPVKAYADDESSVLSYLARKAAKEGNAELARYYSTFAIQAAEQEAKKKAKAELKQQQLKEQLERERQRQEVVVDNREATLTRDLNNNPDSLIRFRYDLSKDKVVRIFSKEGLVVSDPNKKFIDMVIYNFEGKTLKLPAPSPRDKNTCVGGGMLGSILKDEGFFGICKVEFKDEDRVLDKFYIHIKE